ncbi:hypothetical protein HanRHA438_Chr08g0334781 [Helianthus annuus]|nr:hypothetical protein HanRHA438_Chr08g0334781 [Helianthus annuus]
MFVGRRVKPNATLNMTSRGVHGSVRFLGKIKTETEMSVFGFLKPFGFGFFGFYVIDKNPKIVSNT